MRTISSKEAPASGASIDEDVDTVGELLLTLGRVVSLRDPLHASFEGVPNNPAQLHALIWLGTDGPLTMGELARRIGITEKTVTGIVDRLEKQQLCQRVRDVVDRRVIRVALVPRGVTTFKKLQRQIREKMAGFLALLDAPDRRDLVRIFTKLIDRMEAPAPNGGTRGEER